MILTASPPQNVATANNCRYRAASLHTHTHTRASSLRRVYLYDKCVVSVVSGQIIICHLSGGHEGAICYLDNEWCSLENLPITHSVETVMRPTALLPWRPEARFFDTLASYGCHSFHLGFALVVNFTVNLSFCEAEQRYIEPLYR